MSITARQEEILSLIKKNISRYGIAPSLREIGQDLGISGEAVRLSLISLEKKGLIKRDKNKKRAILLCREETENILNTYVPFFNTEPTLQEARDPKSELYAPLEKALFDGSVYSFTVTSESMIDAGILPGDTAFISARKTARNGDIVIAEINEKLDLRRYKSLPGYIELVPDNPSMVTKKASLDSVFGVLIKIERRYISENVNSRE